MFFAGVATNNSTDVMVEKHHTSIHFQNQTDYPANAATMVMQIFLNQRAALFFTRYSRIAFRFELRPLASRIGLLGGLALRSDRVGQQREIL